jgi:hypothetical protein
MWGTEWISILESHLAQPRILKNHTFRYIDLTQYSTWSIEIEDVSADPVTDIGCDNPVF